jgi:hypothetical protein
MRWSLISVFRERSSSGRSERTGLVGTGPAGTWYTRRMSLVRPMTLAADHV